MNAYIVTKPGVLGEKPHLKGHRITVQQIVIWHLRLGVGIDEIAHEYQLSQAAVHAALSYYYDNQALIESDIESDENYIEEMKQSYFSILDKKLKELVSA